jgi:hypothetical protein
MTFYQHLRLWLFGDGICPRGRWSHLNFCMRRAR